MDDYIGAIIIFVIFVLGPLLERMKRKRQGPPTPPPPQERRPFPRPSEQSRLPEATRAEPVRTPAPVAAEPRRAETTAADMLPDDLWEILTGQPKPRSTPPRAPEPEFESEETEDEESIAAKDVMIETRRSRFEEAMPIEAPPPREFPVVVSMEEMPDPRKRHAAFHDKVHLDVGVKIQRLTGPRYFSSPADLRRTMIMHVVLGPCKALEPEGEIR
ncbi:MAG: hypothetical protein WEE89_12460 [Gemmatimonadota bacterium]